MPLDAAIQAKFERDLKWKHVWPRCLFGLIATVEIIVGAVGYLFSVYHIAIPTLSGTLSN